MLSYRGPNAPAAILVLPDQAPRADSLEAIVRMTDAEIREAREGFSTRTSDQKRRKASTKLVIVTPSDFLPSPSRSRLVTPSLMDPRSSPFNGSARQVNTFPRSGRGWMERVCVPPFLPRQFSSKSFFKCKLLFGIKPSILRSNLFSVD